MELSLEVPGDPGLLLEVLGPGLSGEGKEEFVAGADAFSTTWVISSSEIFI